jgi:hypothetical protein
MKNYWLLFLLTLIVSSHAAFADTKDDEATSLTPAQDKVEAPKVDDTTNNRMKTLEGSKSRFSGQFNISYQGSTISHPFDGDAPNLSGQTPPPLVTLSGTVSARYRIDPVTTTGIGIGLLTQTPFQGPKNTTASEPYADIARSYTIDKIHNRVDFQFTKYTSDQYNTQLGYLEGLTLTNESTYLFSFGLTAGFLLELDYNFFSNDPMYSPLGIARNQTQWDVITDPFFEYTLNKTFNLRTVIGIQSLNNRDLASDFALFHPSIYETLGLGCQVLPAWFIYPFVQFFPGNMESANTVVGFNTIINLF